MQTQLTEMPVLTQDQKFWAKSRAKLRSSLFPRKILLIDENIQFCRRFRQAAQEYNSLVVYCNSIASITRLIEVDRFDLIIITKEFQSYAGNLWLISCETVE